MSLMLLAKVFVQRVGRFARVGHQGSSAGVPLIAKPNVQETFTCLIAYFQRGLMPNA